MKKIVVFFIFVALLSGCSKQENNIKIGAVLPLTGDVASYGKDSKDGIDLAIELANSSQSKNQFQAIYQDSQGDPKVAVTALQQLLLDSDIKSVIGGNISSTTMAMVPIINSKQIIMISPSASTPKLTGASKYFFRVFPSDVAEGSFIADKVALEFPNGKVCIMYFNNDYGVGLKNVFKEQSDKNGIKIENIFPYDKDQTDFRTILTKIKNYKPNAVYIAGYYKDAGYILKQAKQLNLKTTFWGATTMEDPQLIEIAGNAANGLKYPISTGYDQNSKDTVVQNFISKYKAKFGKGPGLVSALGYDCANLLIDATNSKGNSPDGIREYLISLKNYDGASGKMSFDEDGDVHKPIILKIVKNGKFSNL